MKDPMPRLDLAPKLKRPLQLWNPLDYLRLLYWVFYFPQALRWYVDMFSSIYVHKKTLSFLMGLQLLFEDKVRKTLFLQALFCMLLSFSISLYLFRINKWAPFFDFGYFYFFACLVIVFYLYRFFVSGIISGELLFLKMHFLFFSPLLIILFLALVIAVSILSFIVFFLVSSLAIGLVFSSILFLYSIFSSGNYKRLFEDILLGLLSGLVLGYIVSFISFLPVTLTIAPVALAVFFRLDDWLIMNLALCFTSKTKGKTLLPRVSSIPFSRCEKILEDSFADNWDTLVQSSVEIMKYTSQSKLVIEKLDELFYREDEFISESLLVWRVSRFFDLYKGASAWKLADWGELQHVPSSIGVGFFFLKKRQARSAADSFYEVRDIIYGAEMYILAETLDLCTQAQEFNQIHPLQLPPCPEPDPSKRLRQESWPALEAFHRVTQDAQLIHQSRSKATQAQALARAQGELQQILDNQDQLPQAEGGLIIDIATTWRDALLSIASEIGNIEILEPVTNPYTIGDPVEGNRFVGREDLLRELESLWLGAENLPSVLVYGHRRMGKTSILRNLTGGADLKLIYVNLQLLGSVTQGLSEVLLAIADDIAQHLDISAPADEAFLNCPQRTFERYLRDVLSQLDCRALIIALDEFEIIEDLIEKGQLSPDFMGYLRGLIQMDKRLAFALAGLHTLEEMTRDYFEPFFGSTYGIPVSFLTEAASRQILENPSNDFPLEYDPNAVDEIYRLTHGQPYLVQLIGFQLVRRFNEQVFETGRERDPRLTVADVAAVTDISQADLFRNGRYYFEGVWNQAAQGAPGQQAILQTLAPHLDGLTVAELQAQLPHLGNLAAALGTLERHDAIQRVADRYCITVELFRRWCERLGSGG